MKIFQQRSNKSFYNGFFGGEYKDRFDGEVSKTLAMVDEEGNPPSIPTRVKIINAMFDAYIEQTGEVPDGVQVQRLANWMLFEDLTNNHPDKVTREPYPFLTKRQLRTRYNRERADEHILETFTRQKYLGGQKQSALKKSE